MADGITEVSFRRLPSILCLYWQVYLRWGQKNEIVIVVVWSLTYLNYDLFVESARKNVY